jgi:RNA polymerase sigma factor for flagellar operon FliA
MRSSDPWLLSIRNAIVPMTQARGDLQAGPEPGRIAPETILELWREYKRTGAAALRDRLVLSLAPIVKYIVYRKLRETPPHIEVDDFISCGIEALIRSIDRYDPDKGATLEQFAWIRIHGAILDELRRFDWAPRSMRRLERECNGVRERFTAIHRRAPTNEELCEALAISEQQLADLFDDVARSEVASLNALVLGDENAPIERVDTLASTDRRTDPEFAAMRQRAIESLRVAFAELPARERCVARLLHVENLTLREAGAILGVSESRVSQIHSQLKLNLQRRLQADELLFLEVA